MQARKLYFQQRRSHDNLQMVHEEDQDPRNIALLDTGKRFGASIVGDVKILASSVFNDVIYVAQKNAVDTPKASYLVANFLEFKKDEQCSGIMKIKKWVVDSKLNVWAIGRSVVLEEPSFKYHNVSIYHIRTYSTIEGNEGIVWAPLIHIKKPVFGIAQFICGPPSEKLLFEI